MSSFHFIQGIIQHIEVPFESHYSIYIKSDPHMKFTSGSHPSWSRTTLAGQKFQHTT
jgi:hypothetical protein